MSVTTTAPPQKVRTTAQNIGLILSFIVLGGILLLPTPETLSTGGHRMIGVLAFAIILWMTSAVSYPVSATMITAPYRFTIRILTKSRSTCQGYGHSQCLEADHFWLFFTSHDSRRCCYVYLCSYA